MTGVQTCALPICFPVTIQEVLHKVVQDRSGSGVIEIWPALRSSYTDAVVDLTEAKGRFRLKENFTQWSINEVSSYGITFDCVEVL